MRALTVGEKRLLEVLVRGHPVTFTQQELATQLNIERLPGARLRALEGLGLVERADRKYWRAAAAAVNPPRADDPAPAPIRRPRRGGWLQRLFSAGVCIAAAIVMVGCFRPLASAELSAAGTGQLIAAYEKAQRYDGLGGWHPWSGREEYLRAVRGRAVEIYGWPHAEALEVQTGTVRQGMPRQQAWWAWGPPWRIERATMPYGAVERWYYDLAGGVYLSEITLHDGSVVWWRTDDASRFSVRP